MEMPVEAVCHYSCPALRNTLHWWTPIKDLIKSEIQSRLQADWQCGGGDVPGITGQLVASGTFFSLVWECLI